MEDEMYQSPKLERYGTFRELTLGGGAVNVDPFGSNGGIGCTQTTPGHFDCASGAGQV